MTIPDHYQYYINRTNKEQLFTEVEEASGGYLPRFGGTGGESVDSAGYSLIE